MGEDRPGRPLQLQEVLHRHLCQGVAGVQLHDEPDHDGDQHDGLTPAIVDVCEPEQQSTGLVYTGDLGEGKL